MAFTQMSCYCFCCQRHPWKCAERFEYAVFKVLLIRKYNRKLPLQAGSIEGQMVEMGLTTTSFLNAEKFPVLVPNSLFSSQVIVNKSCAEWRAIVTKIPLQINDLDKVPQIANDINSLPRSRSKVFLGKEAPYSFLSRIESSFAELTLGCNLKHMRKGEYYSMEQDILLRSVQIIKQHGATLSSSF